jgi:hypothetical protein
MSGNADEKVGAVGASDRADVVEREFIGVGALPAMGSVDSTV